MIYLVGTDGIDEDIWAIVGRKIDVLSGSLQAKKSGFTTAVTATGGVPGANARGTVLQQLQLQASARGGPAAAPAKPQLQLQPATVSAAHKPSEVVVVDEDEDFDLLCVLAADAVAASHKSSQ